MAEANTAYKAVLAALDTVGATAEVAIHIEKRLPVQGGMGAGSANAAAALVALDKELKGQGIAPPLGPENLRIAAAIGSDVPLFLVGGAVLGLGRGEQVYPLPDLPVLRCVVALPEAGVSTAVAFRDWDAKWNLREMGKTVDSLTRFGPSGRLNELSRTFATAFCEPHSSGVFALGQDLALNPLLALVRTGIENDFEEVVFPQNPLFGEIKRTLAGSDVPEQAAVYAAMSGSGSALFGLYATEEAAFAAEGRLTRMGISWMRTKTLPRKEYWRHMLVAEKATN
jgi:4-diphosphocytidyl-2-C-methyl-D-erythritol kinase